MSNIVLQQIGTLAEKLGMEAAAANELMGVLKATAFKGQVSDAQLSALLVVANQYGLNPWTKEIYAFPDKNNGIVPVVGVDGWARIINSHPQFDGMDFEQDDSACSCSMYRKDRSRPIRVTEYASECRRSTAPWQSHPKRMLRHKAMIQCARLAFGFVGIYDEDEAERIRDMGTAEVVGSRPLDGAATAEIVLPAYTDAILKTDAPNIAKSVRAKRFTVDSALAQIRTRFTVDAALEKKLRDEVARLLEPEPATAAPAYYPSAEQRAELDGLFQQWGMGDTEVCQHFGVAQLGDLKPEQHGAVVAFIMNGE